MRRLILIAGAMSIAAVGLLAQSTTLTRAQQARTDCGRIVLSNTSTNRTRLATCLSDLDGLIAALSPTPPPPSGNQVPSASAGGPYATAVGASLALAGSGSDPDGDPLTYAWNFGDGSSGTVATPTHTYVTSGTFTAALTVNDGRGGVATSSAVVTVTPTPPPPPPPPPTTSSYYGTKWGADELANTTIGPNIQGDYRFRADYSGSLSAIHTYFQTGSGYSAGNSGTYRIDLKTDDGTATHNPSNTVLATTTEMNPATMFVTETFAAPATLTAGVLYHLVYTNTATNPGSNYSSLDMLYLDAEPTNAQPTVPDTDWAHAYNGGTVASPRWTWRHGYMPTLELVYGDGHVSGNGYMESWIGTSRHTIGGTNKIREAFTVSGGDKIVTSVSLRLRSDGATSPLTVTLQTSTGTVLETGTISAGSIAQSDDWATYTFTQPRTLVNGVAYVVAFSAPSGSFYSAFPIRQGGSYNFNAPTYFSDGLAQYSTNGTTWQNWDAWGSPSTEGDLQFYFRVQ